MLAGIALTSSAARAEPFAFTFSQGGFGETEIFDSAWSTPSRYLLEVARRMRQAQPTADLFAVANPLLPLIPAQIAEWLAATGGKPGLVTDNANFPLLYVLPRRLVEEDERFLLLLTMADAELDMKLLSAFLAEDCPRYRVGMTVGDYPVSTDTGWFQGVGRQMMLRMLSAAALSVIDKRPDWRSLPFASYQPYHAGTVLFYNLASRDMAESLYERQVLCSVYKDIWRAFPSKQDPIWLKLPWLPRDGSVDELQYLAHSVSRLGGEVLDNNFLVFMRYSRIYNRTPFHLADQLKFALGDSMLSPERTLHGQPPAVSNRCQLPVRPLRLLFHLTGGWPLKSYPEDHLRGMLRALQGLGCEITLVDRPDLAGAGIASVAADETGLLAEAVSQHHIFIGVDSFPHHYVRHVLGWPTIGVFANTKPCNSDARQAEDYKALAGALPCNPCGAETACPVFGREDCTNFVEPQILIDEIFRMANQIYGFTA